MRLRSETDAPAADAGAKLYSPAFFRDESEFIAALKAGRSDAQAELVRRHYKRVAAVMHRVLGDDTDLEDVVQDVFVKAMLGAHAFRGTSENLEAWVVGIAVFSARGLIRRRTLWRRFFSAAPAPEAAEPTHTTNLEDVDAVRRIYAVFDKLPADERIALALTLIDQMALHQVALACNVSSSTIKRRLKKARKRFEGLVRFDPVLRELSEREHHDDE